MLESLRVCRNGTVRGGSMSGAERCESCFVMLTSESTVDIEDLLRLCRDVRLSSRGFMSGGSFEILRNKVAR